MGVQFTILMLIVLTTGSATTAQSASTPQCLACHPSHYASHGPCSFCHGGDPRTNRKNIAHANYIPARYAFHTFSASRQVRNGKATMIAFGCRRCHTLFGRGRRTAADLDTLVRRSSPQQIHAAIKTPARQMPDFYFTDRQVVELVNAIEYAGLKADQKRPETPQIVHFSGQGQRAEYAFEKRCGACHKLLSEHLGGIGTGAIGPNLSGLFSEFYPATFQGNERWNPEALRKWLQNPRRICPATPMRPVLLDKQELAEIVKILQGAP